MMSQVKLKSTYNKLRGEIRGLVQRYCKNGYLNAREIAVLHRNSERICRLGGKRIYKYAQNIINQNQIA